jgi:hypothetical protein
MLPVDRPVTQAEVWEETPAEAANDTPVTTVPGLLEPTVVGAERPPEPADAEAAVTEPLPRPPARSSAPPSVPAGSGQRTRPAGGHREARGRANASRSHSRLPAHLTPDQVLELVRRERREALDVRDPIAIALAAERYNTMATILAPLDPAETLDLHRPLLSVSQTAKMLGYNAKEVRRLLGQGKIAGRKVGNEWRIPLWAVL